MVGNQIERISPEPITPPAELELTRIGDLGGPVFGLKRGIGLGLVPGPRIWPVGAAVITDSPDAVRKCAREQLALGASPICCWSMAIRSRICR